MKNATLANNVNNENIFTPHKDIGFVKLHRRIFEWEWYTDNNVKSLFLHCLLKANHTRKNWHGVVIERGSFITSYEKLAYELNLSVQQIRTAIKKLKLTNEITYHSTSQYSVITINNYNQYQDDNRQNDKLITNQQQSNNKQVTTTNNDKNENKKICQLSFDEFWQMYPVKKSKKQANDKYKVALSKVEHSQIMQGLENYLQYIKTNNIEMQYIKHPTTWINGECWNDKYITAKKSNGIF